MKYLMFAVWDSATQNYGRPIFALTPGQASRSFSDEVNRASDDNQYFKHPDDFELRQVGAFDDNTGELFAMPPQTILRGKDTKQ